MNIFYVLQFKIQFYFQQFYTWMEFVSVRILVGTWKRKSLLGLAYLENILVHMLKVRRDSLPSWVIQVFKDPRLSCLSALAATAVSFGLRWHWVLFLCPHGGRNWCCSVVTPSLMSRRTFPAEWESFSCSGASSLGISQTYS